MKGGRRRWPCYVGSPSLSADIRALKGHLGFPSKPADWRSSVKCRMSRGYPSGFAATCRGVRCSGHTGRVSTSLAVVNRWSFVAQTAGCHGAPLVTVTDPVGDWYAAVPADLGNSYGTLTGDERAARLCGLGLAVADAHAYGLGRQGPQCLPSLVVPGLVACGLGGLALVAADCPVRDAIGWLLAHPTNVKAYLVAGDGQQVYVDTAAVEASEWFAAGFGFGDYVYAAAGLTIDEARAGIDSGALDPQMAFTLAALRGVAIPVG